jgi:hypothetical protein
MRDVLFKRPSTRAGQNKQLEDYAVNKEAKIAAKQKAAEEKAAAKKVRVVAGRQ